MLTDIYGPSSNACLDSMVCSGGILLFDVAPRTSVLVLATWRTACPLSAGKLFYISIHLFIVLSLENQETKGMRRNSCRFAGVVIMSEAILNW